MANTMEGKLISVEQPKTIKTKKGETQSTDFVIETTGDYPKKVCFNVWGDKINLKNYAIGGMVKVHFDLNSRMWKDTWFTTANCYRLDAIGYNANKQPQEDVSPYAVDHEDNDGLPF